MTFITKTSILASLGLFAFAPRGVAAQQNASPAFPQTVKRLKVVDPGFIDQTANACVDFFQYANGAWLAHDTIPQAYSSSGVGRDMQDQNELVVRSVLDDVMARRGTTAAATTPHKLGVFYASCMDSTAVEAAGVGPIRPWLLAIDSITTRAGLVPEIALLQTRGVDVTFTYGAGPDLHDAAHYLAGFGQSGLGLPDRDYYTNTGAEADSLRQAYVDYVTHLFTLAGESVTQSAADARDVMAFETQLALASMTQLAQRDPAALDHALSFDQLRGLAPAVPWNAYFHAVGIAAPVVKVNVAQPDFMKRVDSLLTAAPLNVWRAYFRAHVLENTARWLSTPFVQANFAYNAHFNGAKTLLPRWKRCLRETDGDLGEALGEAYVAKTFPPAARARAKAVIDDIRAAFRERLLHLTWMSDSTRAQALDKLAKMGEKVGYPDKWRDYTRLEVAEGPFVLNVERANRFEWQRTINRPGTPVDTTEWGITVPTVNAYYDPTKNEMVFPAGALEPQTFDPNADDGANYGSLGELGRS